MDRETQVLQIRQFLRHIDARSTDLAEAPYANPVTDYTCPGMQRGFHAGAQPVVTYGRNEPALAHFHHAVRRALGLPPVTR